VKPVDFDYARPDTVDAAIKLVADDSRTAKMMAGSQSLGPMLNLRLVQPDLIVDLTGIEELRRIEERTDQILIGACITHADIEDLRVPDITQGALPTVANGIAYRAVRNRGTIGGSLTHADPSADWHSILAAVGAQVVLRGPNGERKIAVEAYMIGALEADLQPGEVLVRVEVPRLSKSARWGYYKNCRKPGEFAHAIGAFVTDPDRGVSRAVIGADALLDLRESLRLDCRTGLRPEESVTSFTPCAVSFPMTIRRGERVVKVMRSKVRSVFSLLSAPIVASGMTTRPRTARHPICQPKVQAPDRYPVHVPAAPKNATVKPVIRLSPKE